MSTAKAEWRKLTDSLSAETIQLHTVSRYVQVCILLQNISTTLADDNTKLHCRGEIDLKLSGPQLPKENTRCTFMMSDNAPRDLYFAPRFDITCRRFQKEKRFLRNDVAQFLDMVRVIPANRDYLTTSVKYWSCSSGRE
jgi:hypothetical protein